MTHADASGAGADRAEKYRVRWHYSQQVVSWSRQSTCQLGIVTRISVARLGAVDIERALECEVCPNSKVGALRRYAFGNDIRANVHREYTACCG